MKNTYLSIVYPSTSRVKYKQCSQGQMILTYAQGSGLVTNNVAEATALWQGLKVEK
jgi:hypothetical protein